MLLLIIFGFVAGAATALSPCVLPVLPVAPSADGALRKPERGVETHALTFG